MINSGIGNNDITLSVGFDYSKAIGQDAPRAAAELQKVFNNFGGKNRALIEPLGRISSSTSEFAKSLEAANARVIAFGASVGIIYNIQKAFTELVKSTVQVEKKLTDINVVLTTSSSQLRKFGDELFSIANDTGKSFEEVSNAAIEFSRQGLGVQETLKRTKDALILTRIAGIDTKDAVDALTAGVNSFSKSLIDSTQIVNKFAAVDAAFAVSSQDLAEALRRVGSSAQDAGVDLDELAGLVTSVQQTTARGGAVIGNALKTIFSRLSRGETIRELKDLGVQIDESQNGIEKLKALSAALQNVSGTQGAAIKEAAGGVYQINVVSAALGDLSKQYGIYEQALMKSRGATDEAISRNKELGTTLAALATTTENNLVKAFSKIGSLSIDTPFRSILNGLNSLIIEPLGKIGDEGGSEFVKNFMKGVGKFIEGPGLTYLSLVGLNLTKALVGFAGDSFRQLQNYNKSNAQLLATQKGISLELERDQNLVLGIASGNIKVADAQSLIIQRLQQDLALREKIAAISKGIGQGVIKSGIAYSAETGTPQRIKKTFAGGLVPSPSEMFTESLGAINGGYKPGKVKVTNIPGLGRAIYNDNEKIKNFPGLAQPAIMPPQNSSAGQKYQKNFYGKHGFNPYMAGGNIPNFAFKSRAGSFGDVEFENKYGGGIMDIMGKTAEIGVFDTLKKGQGHSRGLYQDLFADLRKKGIKTVKGFLIPQTDNKPRENTDLSNIKALLPQIIRGRYGKSSVLSVGDKTFNIPGGKDFDNYLNANQKSIWGAVSRGEDVDYVTYLNKGNIPNFAKYPSHRNFLKRNTDESVLKMLEAYPAKFGSYNKKYLNIDLPQGESKVRYSDPIDAIEFEKRLYQLGLDRGYIANKGLVPNFSGLAGAIKRESQSVPASTIKVGMDSRLKSPQNPSGLGVYNTIHEPNGLSQGITRAYSEGLNPKTYNVPNFVPPSKFVRGDFGIESGSGIPANVYKQIQSDIKKNLRDLFSEFEKGSLSARKMTDKLEELKVQFNLTDSSLLKAKSAFSKFKKEVQVDRDFEDALGLTPKTVSGQFAKSQMGAIGAQRAAGAQSRALLTGNLGMYETNPYESEYRGLMGIFDPENYRRKIEMDTEKARREQAVIQKQIEEQTKLSNKVTSLRQKADSFNFLGSGRAIKEAVNLQKSGAITKEEVDALKGLRNNRVQTAAGLGSFLVPTVLTPALQGISDNKKYQASVEAGSSVASLGLTGLSVGATMGGNAGPIGAGIGALVGFLTTLPSLLKAINDPIPELGMRLEKLQENFIKSSSVLQQYSSLTEKLSEIQSGGISGIKQKDIDRLSFERQKALNQVNPEYRPKLLELAKGGDISGLRNFEGIINQIESRKLSSGKSLEKFIETDNKKFTFSNILEKTPGPGISQIKLARDIIRNKDLIFNKDTDSSFNPYSLGLSGAVGLFGAARGINEQEIKQRLAGRRDRVDLARGAVSEISGFSNVDGQSVFELLFKDKNLQQKIGNASGIQDINKLLTDLGSKNKIKGLSDYLRDLSKVSDEETKGLILKFFRNQFSEAGVNSTKAGELVNTEKEKNKVIDDSIKSVLEFNTSLLKLSAEFDKLNQGKLIDLETAFSLDKIKLNVKNALESLGAGDFKKVGLKYKESELERQQKLSLGLAGLESQTNQEYLNKITDFQTTLISKGIERLSDKKGGDLQSFKADSKQYEDTITNLFESVGLNDISFDKFGKETVDSIIDSLNKNSDNFSFLSDEDKRFLTKELPKLRQDIEKTSLLKSVKEAQLKKEFEASGKLNTAQQKGEFDILGGTNKYNLDLLRNSNLFDVGQTRVSANFEKNQQLQRLRDEFNLSNLGGGNRLNKQFDINQRNILDQYNFESGNLLPRLLQEGGKDSLQFQDATKNVKSQEDLNRLITDYSIKKAFGANKDKDSIDNLNKLLTIQEQLKSSQDKLNISKEKALETEKKTLEFQKELLKYRFQEERISDNLKNIEGKIRVGGRLSGGDIKSVVKEQFDYTPRDFQRDAVLGVNEVSATIKTSFSGAISSIIKDGKSFGDAFREMLIGVLNKIVDKTSDITTNLLFNGISSAASSFAQGRNAGGLIKGYSTGGQVTGGSGVRDDVPAMLTDGEYVIKKSAVEAIGKANLDKINYGNDNISFNLKNDYAYNDPKFPTSGKLDVSSALSNFGLMDTGISRTNELRIEKEQNLISYLEQKRSYDKNVSDAMKAFRQQKRNRLYGAYLSAAAGVAGAGLSSAFGPAAGSGASKGVDFNGFQNTGFRTAANGGLIQRFAAGGHVFGGNSITDTVPAMLTGGEYVIKKDKVSKFGKNFFDNLNNSSPRKYADGGLVTPALMPINTNKGINTDLTIQFNSLTNAINNLSNSIKPNTNKDNYGINNYITVSVSVDGQNSVTTESSVNSQSKGNNRTENDQSQVEKLRKGLENDMGAFINKQMKQGGTIYTFVNGRIGR